jgi:hypothetical protein
MLGKILFILPHQLQASILNCAVGIFPNQVVSHLLSLLPQYRPANLGTTCTTRKSKKWSS